jgi:hypothetical protein
VEVAYSNDAIQHPPHLLTTSLTPRKSRTPPTYQPPIRTTQCASIYVRDSKNNYRFFLVLGTETIETISFWGKYGISIYFQIQNIFKPLPPKS